MGAVVIGLGLSDVLPVRQRPVGQGSQQMRQARPHLGEPVVDLGGNRGVDRAAHQPVALQTPHRQGEHALRDSADGALQLPETQPGGAGRSTALHFATSRLLENGQRIVLVLPRKSPLMELASNPGVLGVLGMDAGPGDLSELLKEDVENTVIVVDDFDTLTNDHSMNPRIEEHIKACRDHHGGVLVACGIDEVGGDVPRCCRHRQEDADRAHPRSPRIRRRLPLLRTTPKIHRRPCPQRPGGPDQHHWLDVGAGSTLRRQ